MTKYHLTFIGRIADRAPILFRIAQLARPLLFILILRAVDEGVASEFIKYIGLFVIILEIYNVILPTDRLYMINSTARDLYYILQGRLRVSVFLLPIGLFYSIIASKIELTNAFALNALILLSSLSICVFSYKYTRTSFKKLIHVEILSISLFILSFITLVFFNNMMAGLFLYFIELPVRSTLLLEGRIKSFIILIIKSRLLKFKQRRRFAGAEEGVIVTSYNHVFRLPFTLPSSNLDPLYFIPAQLCSALYNVILSSRGHPINFPPLLALILQIIMLLLIWVISQTLDGISQIGANLGVLTVLAMIHSLQLIQVPGRTGIITNDVGKKILIFSMIAVVTSTALVNPMIVLAAPIILTVVNLKVKNGRDRNR